MTTLSDQGVITFEWLKLMKQTDTSKYTSTIRPQLTCTFVMEIWGILADKYVQRGDVLRLAICQVEYISELKQAKTIPRVLRVHVA